MARCKEFTVGRGFTIMDGYDADKPHFSMTVELAEDDDFATEVATAIQTVNGVLLEINESGFKQD